MPNGLKPMLSADAAALDAKRCAWAQGDALMAHYHDTEWGVPERDGAKLFAKLALDGFQAGLSWRTILHRRKTFFLSFDGFEPVKVARFSPKRIEELLQDSGIIRHRGKIEATVSNAKAYLKLEASGTTFTDFLWRIISYAPLQHQRCAEAVAPTQSVESVAMHKALKRIGFTFCGPTICYAFMQAVGMINDHTLQCPRHDVLLRSAKKDSDGKKLRPGVA